MPWWRKGEVSEAIAAVTGEWDDEGQSARRDEVHGEGWQSVGAPLVTVLAPTPRLTGSNEEEQHGKRDPDPDHL